VTHTTYEPEAWWQVDLGSARQIGSVQVWNRTDCCGGRLSNFYVFVSDTPFTSTAVGATLAQAGVSNYLTSGTGGTPTTVAVNRTGRYVRVQLQGTESLSLAEVRILP
jgi:alpha-L-fucosidase 2